MHAPVTITKATLFAAALGAILPTAVGGDQNIRAEVQHARATPSSSENPEIAMYGTNFDILLTNRSEKPINIPKSEADDGGTTRIAVLGVQYKPQGGVWKYILQSSWMDVGTVKYASCTSLPPSGTADFGGLADQLAIAKELQADVGSEPTLRFNLTIFCRRSDGKVVSTSVNTEAFVLRLPVQPK
jgi:hypothetical protein